jgi:hypothetical protein
MTGVVYLMFFLTAILGLVLVNLRMATAGLVLNCLADILYATVTLLLCRLLLGVNLWLSLVAALSSLAGCTLDFLDLLHRGPAHVSPLLFFGPFCVLLGLLVARSTFLPRLLGWPLMLAGVAWLAFLVPTVASYARVPIYVLGFLSEAALMVWLLAKGVNEERWQAGQSRNR